MNLGRAAFGFLLLFVFNSASSDEHAAHRAAMQKTRYSATTESYAIPDVELIDQLGRLTGEGNVELVY